MAHRVFDTHDAKDVEEVLRQSRGFGRIVRGVNLLQNPYDSFKLAKAGGAKFVQFDSVQTPDLDLDAYEKCREKSPDILVFGGVRFKYTRETGNPLERDLTEARKRCEAIVTIGSGTGIETPIKKLREFKDILKRFPLFVGAGVTAENVASQLYASDGAIVGSYFKPNGDTQMPVDSSKVRELMDMVWEVRELHPNARR